MNNVDRIVDSILYLKNNASMERKWIETKLLFCIIDDVTPYKTDEEKVKIAIKVSEILARKYDIYGYD